MTNTLFWVEIWSFMIGKFKAISILSYFWPFSSYEKSQIIAFGPRLKRIRSTSKPIISQAVTRAKHVSSMRYLSVTAFTSRVSFYMRCRRDTWSSVWKHLDNALYLCLILLSEIKPTLFFILFFDKRLQKGISL